MNGEEVQDKDLNAEFRNIDANSSGFDAMEEEEALLGVDERQIWLANEQYNMLADFHDASILYTDHFPPLPHDFPCMSSSSWSPSIPAPVKAITCSPSSPSTSSSSYAASWALLKSDAEEDEDKKCRFNHGQHDPMDAPPAALASTASTETPKPLDSSLEGVDYMDVMETLGYMNLIENNDFFDPSCIFRSDNPPEDFKQLEQMSEEEHAMQENARREHEQLISQTKNEETHEEKDPEDMAKVFLEWLRTNKETVSAEDLRSVRIKKATIESAAKRLGGGKEAMKQLLKLVLEWVQSNHLQKGRHSKEESTHFPNQYQDPFQSPNPNANLNSNSTTSKSNPCFTTQSTWIPQRHYVPDPTAVLEAPSAYPPMVGYIGTGPYIDGAPKINDHSPYTAPTMEYQMLGSSHSWPPSRFAPASNYNSFPANSFHPAPQACAGYGNQYPHQHYFSGHQDERLLRFGSSATKEARKKRMARQRRFLSHHRHHHNNHNQQNQHQSENTDPHARLGNDNCNTAAQANPGNSMYWQSVTANSGAASASPVMPVEVAMGHPADRTAAMQGQNFPGRVASDKRQGWKPEKNLRFLLQKVLKQSDVGNLGRIVLPKKEAETHLPELEARDGISIAMEDIGTSRVWNMRYRYWPNNKSRMYLLENTGDFVRANGLQEGDFIVIYSDVKSGKYKFRVKTSQMIRGVKVRQTGQKSESKRTGKSQKNQQATSITTPPVGTNGHWASSSPTAFKKQ
ncbi:B3 domain-containing transcription factor ABI3-like isoform X3 [Carya illinoinensis]|uniref:B3 domain-containing transcription factor ABI3-like isoform X3 n=1 Tax=Carya illinoinensis TaxID=32201 RepID=UPI001C72140B|nr:B3 domain-containing transcription factor ABI3-like isoform X3 [Carya illinoinensis]